MKSLLQQYAAYNNWANQKLIECISNLSDEQINREMVSSFSSIYKTLLHMWLAEDAWMQRIKLTEHVKPEAQDFTGDYNELIKKIKAQSAAWEAWAANATETQLQHVFAFQNFKKEQLKQPVAETLMHVFNHASYHRGQLVTMLRQLGVDTIPSTDLTSFIRLKGKN